jgi:hypothetical protein
MSTRPPAVEYVGGQRHDGPLYRSIVAIDIEGSTGRTNLAKGELRRTMYDLLGRSMDALAISSNHREPLADRGDGVLLLIRPHDDMPKTVLLGQLIPLLTALLGEHNRVAADPSLRIRLRVVVHAGEVHSDARGFYGEAIDIAIRLLDSVAVKTALRHASSPLVLVVSEEIYFGIVAHGYVDGAGYRPLVRVRVANKQRRGWVCIPSKTSELPAHKQGDSSRRLLRSA